VCRKTPFFDLQPIYINNRQYKIFQQENQAVITMDLGSKNNGGMQKPCQTYFDVSSNSWISKRKFYEKGLKSKKFSYIIVTF